MTVSSTELFRPESDLVRLAEEFPQVELLVAVDDSCGDRVRPGELDSDDDRLDGAGDELRAAAERLALPGLRLHRLALPNLLADAVEDDLVAALSELVGFDPEPGVYCLAPARDPVDPDLRAVNRAAQRVAQVYGIPLLRYRCRELVAVAGEG